MSDSIIHDARVFIYEHSPVKADYVPILSSLTAGYDLYEKIFDGAKVAEAKSQDHYYTHLKESSPLRSVVLLIPVLGNAVVGFSDLIVGIYHWASKKPAQDAPIQEKPPLFTFEIPEKSEAELRKEIDEEIEDGIKFLQKSGYSRKMILDMKIENEEKESSPNSLKLEILKQKLQELEPKGVVPRIKVQETEIAKKEEVVKQSEPAPVTKTKEPPKPLEGKALFTQLIGFLGENRNNPEKVGEDQLNKLAECLKNIPLNAESDSQWIGTFKEVWQFLPMSFRQDNIQNIPENWMTGLNLDKSVKTALQQVDLGQLKNEQLLHELAESGKSISSEDEEKIGSFITTCGLSESTIRDLEKIWLQMAEETRNLWLEDGEIRPAIGSMSLAKMEEILKGK